MHLFFAGESLRKNVGGLTNEVLLCSFCASVVSGNFVMKVTKILDLYTFTLFWTITSILWPYNF